MKDIRIDDMTGNMVIYSSYRNKRPHDNRKVSIKNEEKPEHSPTCPFCIGNEDMCGDSQDEISLEGKWLAKSVLNKFPILDMSTDEIYGQHEVIVESNRHNASYFEMGQDEFVNIFKIYQMRSKALSQVDGISYIDRKSVV